MVKSLFVLHTQYNLILACGLLHQSKENDLILFVDFKLTEGLKDRLKNSFNRIQYIDGNFPKNDLDSKSKMNKITNDCKLIKDFINVSYDRIFIVDDMCIQEMFSLKCSAKYNQHIDMCWLEDGGNAYFYNGTVSKGMGSTPIKRTIRKVFFSIKFGLWNYYDLGKIIGTHKLLKKGYFIFPKFARHEYSKREKTLITEEEFITGMNMIFQGRSIHFEIGGVLIALDKLEVYGNKLQVVVSCLEKLLENTERKIYYKYHPRETETLPILKDAVELDKTIALESYLTNADTRDLTILGIKSTALQTAVKMGFRTISLINQVEDSDEVVQFYKSIGIECI